MCLQPTPDPYLSGHIFNINCPNDVTLQISLNSQPSNREISINMRSTESV